MRTKIFILISWFAIVALAEDVRVPTFRASPGSPSASTQGSMGDLWMDWLSPALWVKTNGTEQAGWSVLISAGATPSGSLSVTTLTAGQANIGSGTDPGQIDIYGPGGTSGATLTASATGVLDLSSGASLSGKTNILADDGSQLTFNGSPVQLVQSTVYVQPNLWTNGVTTNITSGSDIEIFTIPDGYRAIPYLALISTNATDSSTFVFLKVKIGTNYFQVGSASVTSSTRQTITYPDFIFEPGDVVALRATKAGASALWSFSLVPTAVAVRTVRLSSISASATNVLYTVPDGFHALPVGASGLGGPNRTISGAVMGRATQASGSTIIYTMLINGAMVGTVSVSSTDGTTTAGSTVLLQVGALHSGEAVIISSPSANATQFAYATVYEVAN